MNDEWNITCLYNVKEYIVWTILRTKKNKKVEVLYIATKGKRSKPPNTYSRIN